MKAEDIMKLKEGDVIYQIRYFMKRMVSGMEVIKVNEKSIRVKYMVVEGFGNKIGSTNTLTKYKMCERADKYFRTLEEAVDNSLKNHRNRLVDIKSETEGINEEIDSLKVYRKYLSKHKMG